MKRAAWFVLAIGVVIFTVFSAALAFAGDVELGITGPAQRAYYVGIGGTAHYLDGWVYNGADPGNNCTDIAVTAVAKNSSDVALTTLIFPLPVHVLNAGNSQFFHLQVYPPTGTHHWDMSVTGASTTATYLGTIPAWDRTTDAAGRRIYTANFSTGSGSISSLIVAGKEHGNTVDDRLGRRRSFLNSMTDVSHANAAYGPGRTLPMRLEGLRSTALPFLFQFGGACWVPYTPQVVQRFYNKRNGIALLHRRCGRGRAGRRHALTHLFLRRAGVPAQHIQPVEHAASLPVLQPAQRFPLLHRRPSREESRDRHALVDL